MSRTSVSWPERSLKRTEYPTASPSETSSSSAMRSATVRAASRRGCVWPMAPRTPRPELEADLGQLRRLARAGLAGDDHDLVLGDRSAQVLAAGADRQLGRIGDVGHRGAPRLDARLGGRDLGIETLERRRAAATPQPVHLPRESMGVADRQPVEPRAQDVGVGGGVHPDRR